MRLILLLVALSSWPENPTLTYLALGGAILITCAYALRGEG